MGINTTKQNTHLTIQRMVNHVVNVHLKSYRKQKPKHERQMILVIAKTCQELTGWQTDSQ